MKKCVLSILLQFQHPGCQPVKVLKLTFGTTMNTKKPIYQKKQKNKNKEKIDKTTTGESHNKMHTKVSPGVGNMRL